jgi:CubicO group peptidase (beta-lactamase class C family)
MPRLLLLSFCLAIMSSLNVLGQNNQTTASTAAFNQSVTSEALEGLGKVVEQYISKDYAVGAELLVLHKGKTLYHKSFGYSDREDKRQWKNNTLCNIRSMTKPITSAAAQILIDRNLLQLDDPVSKYLNSFNNDASKLITVRQVLTHRSGLPLTNLAKPDQYTSLTAQVASAGKKGPEFEPGSKFWYSDLGTDVVGALVEKVSGEPLNEFVKRELLDPLDMSSSLYGIDADDKRLSQAASSYLKVPAGWMAFWTGDSKPIYPFAWGSQTIYSTTTDYAKFLRMMINGGRVGDLQLLSSAAVSRMLAPVSRAKMMQSDALMPTEFRNLEVYYGQMMITYRLIGNQKEKPVVIGHSGSDGTIAWAWPERDLIILYFTQSRGGMTPLRIEEPIDRLIIHQGQKYTEESPPSLRPYLGTFIANYDTFENEEFVVKVKNGKLVLDVPSQMAFELLPPDEKGYWAFVIVPDKIKATFDRNENNEVVGLKLHKAGQIYEVPRKGTARAKELSQRTNAPDAEGIFWVGTLDAQGKKLRLKINIREGAGKLTGELVSLDQGNFTTAVSDIIVKGDKLSFSIPGANATFSGKYEKGGAIAIGTFTQGGVMIPLTLSRSATKETTQGTLKEAWIGELSAGLVKPVMQFRIVTLKSGKTQAYFDSVTEGRTGFKATWSVDGDKLKFDVASIKLQYRGTLNKAGDTAKGIWSQGGREIPLTLKKHATEYEKE